jgi:hypothetical protein
MLCSDGLGALRRAAQRDAQHLLAILALLALALAGGVVTLTLIASLKTCRPHRNRKRARGHSSRWHAAVAFAQVTVSACGRACMRARDMLKTILIDT